MTREENVHYLASLVRPAGNNNYLCFDNWRCHILPLAYTQALCQVIAAKSEVIIGTDEPDSHMHCHVDSQEVFYQLQGTTKFMPEKITLLPGQIKIIPAGVAHQAVPNMHSIAIVILHPVDFAIADAMSGSGNSEQAK
jgi:mannose-6-phosphate isomerase-like protein (cupin superfamily)